MESSSRPPRLDPRNSAIFLDCDGTLAPFAKTPDAVVIPPAVRELLAHLERAADGALAIITGRSLESIDNLFEPLRLPAAGLHGMHRRTNLGAESLYQVRDLAGLERIATALNELAKGDPRLLVENKGQSYSLHYRRAPERGADINAFAKQLVNELSNEFKLLLGNHVVEFMPGQVNKGSAIDAFMSESPYQGRRPVFVGDDVTDENGFDAVNRRGGWSIKVGGGESCANYRLSEPGAVHNWLRDGLETSGG
ncbi:MAG: trehalose-phosphatase [Pseudomonadota bacterium]